MTSVQATEYMPQFHTHTSDNLQNKENNYEVVYHSALFSIVILFITSEGIDLYFNSYFILFTCQEWATECFERKQIS